MNDSTRGPSPTPGGRRKSRYSLLLATLTAAVLFAPVARAGAMRHPHSATVRQGAVVSIRKADPNSDFWVRALQHHILKLGGPRVKTVVAMNADGTVTESAFLHYMAWRESLAPKRFDSFHSDIARLLRHMSPTPTPGAIPPFNPSTPIQPPDFTPLITPQGLVPPPQVPEPASGAMAAAMIAAGFVARRRARRG